MVLVGMVIVTGWDGEMSNLDAYRLSKTIRAKNRKFWAKLL